MAYQKLLERIKKGIKLRFYGKGDKISCDKITI